uniref:glycoside hydrolase domain-containing protein n=1 Tax=Streptomyces aureus TaxID=193461 RepID=UPI000A8D66D4
QQDDAGCAATTLSFVRAWNREVSRLGYVPGYYSSADTGVRDIEAARRAGTADLPAVMWFARWLGRPALYTESVLHPDAWMPHARIHQYAGNVTEAYGGRSLAIDRNAMDAPVARVTPTAGRAAGVSDSGGVPGRAGDAAPHVPRP